MLRKLNIARFSATAITVVLLFSGVLLTVPGEYGVGQTLGATAVGIAGGPVAEEIVSFVPTTEVIEGMNQVTATEGEGIVMTGDAAMATPNPASTIRTTREGLIVYRVEKGDTLSKIAAGYGITVRTITLANKGVRANALRIGQELMLLPVSGVLHERGPEETPESIASLYGVPLERIQSANRDPGSRTLIIPGATEIRSSRPAGSLPSYPNYYIFPTTGWNWGTLHPTGAVDIANVCGTSVYAAAEGLVSYTADGWDEGYGINIIIEHPNNTSTRYAHLNKVSVEEGSYVLQGDTIGLMGNTGRTDGISGCHLHFEVRGARNPFVK